MIHIDGLQISKVTRDIYLIHQIEPPFYFSCCDGLLILPKKGGDEQVIVLDVNIEPKYVNALAYEIGPVSDYICSHGHMDHIAHVHAWEELGAKIWAPHPESSCLLDLKNFYKSFGFDEALDFSIIREFGIINRYKNCSIIHKYTPGDILNFKGYIIDTIPLRGHSKAHVGYFLPLEKILHISCLGFDLSNANAKGFGPWYGFKECEISQYLLDIVKCKGIFKNQANLLTSSHSYIVYQPDTTPFDYMRNKIIENQIKVEIEVNSLNLNGGSEKKILSELLKKDIFFPKKKMRGFLFEIYNFWESWIIKKHLKRIENH